MIQVCPFCGHDLDAELNDGVSQCSHCNQIFNSNIYNKLLAAGWQTKKENLSLEKIKWLLKLDEDFAILVHTYISEYGYSHDEFVSLLKKLGLNK